MAIAVALMLMVKCFDFDVERSPAQIQKPATMLKNRPSPSRETVPLRKGRLEWTDSQIIELVLVTIHI